MQRAQFAREAQAADRFPFEAEAPMENRVAVAVDIECSRRQAEGLERDRDRDGVREKGRGGEHVTPETFAGLRKGELRTEQQQRQGERGRSERSPMGRAVANRHTPFYRLRFSAPPPGARSNP